MIILRDRAALIRSTTADILLAGNTIAGARVEQERVDGIAEGDTPRVIVIADQSAQTASPAGTALTFTVTLNLVIQAIVEDTDLSAAVAKLDTLTVQIKTMLLTAPAFTTLFSNVDSFRVTSSFKQGGAYITGDARILITGTWYEIYNPVPGPKLSAVNGSTPVGNAGTIHSVFPTQPGS